MFLCIRKKSSLVINAKHDRIISVILMLLMIFCFGYTSSGSVLEFCYLCSLLWYLVGMFFFTRIRVFTGLGLYVIYMLFFVQSGPLLEGMYTQLSSEVILIMLVYNLLAPFIAFIFNRNPVKKGYTPLRNKTYLQLNIYTLYGIGVLSILIYFRWVGRIPMFADDAENFRIQAQAGKGFLIIIAQTCLSVSVMLITNSKMRLICLCGAMFLLLGAGFRTPTFLLFVYYFLTFRIGRGKKFVIPGIIAVLFLVIVYGVTGALRSSNIWYFASIYKPIVWRFYVGSSNFDIIFQRFPNNSFQYGYSMINDLMVMLPGAQTTFMYQLKDIIGYQFDGGSLIPTVFGEGYYNWGIMGAIIWPHILLLMVMNMDKKVRHRCDGKVYYVFCFALSTFSANSLVPTLLNVIVPLTLVYGAVEMLNRSNRPVMEDRHDE